MKLKQWISVAVGCVFALSSAAACGPGEETPKIPVPDAVFSDLWTEGAEKEFALGETYTLEINEDIGANNYILLDYESACGLDSTFYFAEQGNPENGFEERFYLAPEDSEFRQIIDYYGEYLYDKTLSRIEFRCVGNTGGAFRLNKMEIAEHAVDFSLVDFQDPSALEENMQLFLQGSYVKLGITLKSGGAINWLSSVNENISFSADLQNNGYVQERPCISRTTSTSSTRTIPGVWCSSPFTVRGGTPSPNRKTTIYADTSITTATARPRRCNGPTTPYRGGIDTKISPA